MAFNTSTSEQRVELLRQAEKTANLTRRVTIGSGVMDDAAKAQGDALCSMLESALADIGYGVLPSDTAAVANGAALTVPVTGTYTTTATIAVANGVITGITLS